MRLILTAGYNCFFCACSGTLAFTHVAVERRCQWRAPD